MAFFQDPAFVQTLLDASPDLFFFKDAGGVYRYVNKSFCELLELSPSMVLGLTDFGIFPPETAEQHHRADVRVLTAGQAQSFEYMVDLKK